MIDYLVPEFLVNFDPASNQGIRNPAGGMRTKIKSVERASTLYQLYLRTSVADLRSSFVLVEPIFFQGKQDEDVKLLSEYDGYKILYCSEMEVLRWPGEFRQRVIDACNLVTYCSDYHRRLLEAVDIKDMQLQTDPIDGTLFRPAPEKKMQVITAGWISSAKNSEFVRDLYTELQDYDIETVYVGGSTLWGFIEKDNLKLERDIRAVTDIFVDSVPQSIFAEYLAEAAFFVGNNMHDTFSGCHAEAMASGCITVAGGHPIYKERSPHAVKAGVETTIQKLQALTANFNRLPNPQYFEDARNHFEGSYSFDAFNRQLQSIIEPNIRHGWV